MWCWTTVFVFVLFEPARVLLLFGLLGYGENDWKLTALLAKGSHQFTASLAKGSHQFTAQCY